MIVLKCLRARLLLFSLLLLLVWITCYYLMKSSPKELPHAPSESLAHKKGAPIVLDIAVYYECLCPDSRSFFIKQLLPAVEKIPNLLNVEFVPYGKAETEVIGPSKKYRFKCQHGPQECLGNKIHACTIARVSNLVTTAQVLTCMISGKIIPEESGKQCAEEYKLDWADIKQCAYGNEGDELLKFYGDKTNELVPKVSFIPTILLNNDQGNQAAILKDLWKQICLKFQEIGWSPKECTI